MRLAGAGFLLLSTIACSSMPSASADAGLDVDPAMKLNTLTSGEQQALCDWTNQEEGGYGTVVLCDASQASLEADKDQATCVAEEIQHFEQPTCTTTVGDWMMCVQWRLANWCTATPPTPSGQCAAIQTGCYGSASPDAGTD